MCLRVFAFTLRLYGAKWGHAKGWGGIYGENYLFFCSREYNVVIENETESRSQRKADDIGRNIVGQRRIQTEDVVREQQAELRNPNAAHVRKEE